MSAMRRPARRGVKRGFWCGILLPVMALAQAPHAPTVYGTASAEPPPAENCQIIVSEPELNYGAVTRYALREAPGSNNLLLGKRQVTLNVSCVNAVKIGVSFRGPSVGADYLFGTQGRVVIRVIDAQLDGRSVNLGSANVAGMMPVSSAAAVQFVPGQVVVPVENGQPATGTRFSATVEMDPSLPMDAAHVQGRSTMETVGTFEVLWR